MKFNHLCVVPIIQSDLILTIFIVFTVIRLVKLKYSKRFYPQTPVMVSASCVKIRSYRKPRFRDDKRGTKSPQSTRVVIL